METKTSTWRTALRLPTGGVLIGQVGEPHAVLLQRLPNVADCELGFVDRFDRFHTRADALPACGAAQGFTMKYPLVLRRYIAWAERKPIRYLYVTAVGSLALLAALITYCEVFV